MNIFFHYGTNVNLSFAEIKSFFNKKIEKLKFTLDKNNKIIFANIILSNVQINNIQKNL